MEGYGRKKVAICTSVEKRALTTVLIFNLFQSYFALDENNVNVSA